LKFKKDAVLEGIFYTLISSVFYQILYQDWLMFVVSLYT